MEANFWLDKWEKNVIGFHGKEANPLLVRYFKALCLPKGSRVFLPLCGKTLDMAWLLSQGYQIAGAELSEIAIGQLFDELGIKPQINILGKTKHYHAPKIDIFVGDIFDLSQAILGLVNAVYDRAALVALPKAMRDRYTKHLRTITHKSPQLLITFEYDQSLMQGPPFSISGEEVKAHYQTDYDLTLLETVQVSGGLKDKCDATECVWLLR